jgi:hypothetical protein
MEYARCSGSLDPLCCFFLWVSISLEGPLNARRFSLGLGCGFDALICVVELEASAWIWVEEIWMLRVSFKLGIRVALKLIGDVKFRCFGFDWGSEV